MEFRELKTFQVAASLLSFNKAARVLNYAQSTVSSQIQSLENSLGITLFIRSGNKIKLTPEGIQLLKYTQRLLNLEDEILCSFKHLNETTGNLIIKTPQSVAAYYLPPVIKDFQLKFPNIGFDFDGCVGYNVNEIFNAGLLDIAFLICDSFADNHLYVEELTNVDLAFISNPHDYENTGTISSVDEFQGKTLLLSKSDCSYRMIFEKMLIEANVKPGKKLEINSPEAVKKLLLSGCNGIALLPLSAVEQELSDGSLIRLNWEGPSFNAKLYMIWKKEKYQTEALRAFIHAVRIFFGKVL
ncbi:MAG TPA: LysR family transcriptional regulator [Bacteroidales bacterium]|nr:LysR family transcriptional regulator [Bacteroidales bacterium]